MPPPRPEKTHSLNDFAGFLAAVAAEGVEVIIIGGCAVGAYSSLLGETVLSGDLDVLVSRSAFESALDAATRAGAVLHKRPQPRSVPVALLEWQGKEINVLISGAALAPAEVEAQLAREFRVSGSDGAAVLVVDPFQLLREKLACNRAKDQPHIEILRRFLEEEAVHAFETETEPRRRLASPRRFLDVLKQDVLPETLARRLIPIAATATDLRFLAHRAPGPLLEGVLARAETLGLAAEVPRPAPPKERRTAGRR